MAGEEAYTVSVTGTFINRNAAGAYFGSCAVIWSLFFFERIRLEMPAGPPRWKKVPRRVFPPPRQIAIDFAMAFLCLVALFTSQSRAAIALSMVALIIAFTMFFWRHLPGRVGLIASLVGSGGGVLVLLQVMGAGVSERFAGQGLADQGRIETYKSTRMIVDHPVYGTVRHVCVRISELQECECFDLGRLGCSTQYTSGNLRRNGGANCSTGNFRVVDSHGRAD